MSNTKIEQLENNVVKVSLSISKEKFEEGMKYSYNKNKGKVNIPGFRKGKVPRAMIEKAYGKEFLYDDAINFCFPEAYEKAVTESGFIPVSRPSIEEPVFTEDSVEIVASFVKKPDINVEGYKGVKIDKVPTTATEEDVLKFIDSERENNARLINKNDEAVENGDVVKIDFEGFVDGVAFDGGTASDYSLTIGTKTFIDTFEEQLIGKKLGEEVDVNVTFPAGYQNINLSGKPALFKVVIKEINKKELPELDDDFAESVSEFSTVEEYKQSVLEKLTKALEDNAPTERENKVLSKLVEAAKLDVPKVMIENRISQMVEDFRAQIEQQGFKLEDYLSFIGQTPTTLRQVYLKDAIAQVHGRLILEAVAKAEKFLITDEEFDAEVAKIADMYKMDKDQLKAVMRPEDKDGILEDIATQKALKFVVENAIEE